MDFSGTKLPQTDERLSVFPVFFKTKGRFALVAGNGAEALAKARLLTESQIEIRLVAPAPSSDLAVFIIHSDIHHIARPFDASMLDGAIMAFAATGEGAVDRKIMSSARERNIPVNVVDRPELCDFYTPAIVNRAPVAVAIGSEGTGPVLTQIIRSRIEALLPSSLGRLAALAGLYRGAVDRLVARGAPRRRFWRQFFEGSVAKAVDTGDISLARREATKLIKKVDTASGFVSLVGAGPGAADLLTLRAQRVLQEADVIFHDRLVPETVVAMGRRDARRVQVGKLKGRHSVSQDEINRMVVEAAGAGQRVVRLKSGDPLVFGRAGEEMTALRENDIAFEIVPGVTSALAAAAETRIPLTLRGVASTIVFATGHDRNSKVLPDWGQLALTGSTIAIYMGRTVAAEIAARLQEAGLSAATPVAIVESASVSGQRIEAGTIADLAGLTPGRDSDSPALIFVGEALKSGALADAEPISQKSTQDSIAA